MTIESDSKVLANGDQDATMSDAGAKRRPPSDPPDGSGTWAQRLVGSSYGGMLRPEDVLDGSFVADRMRVNFREGKNGEAEVTIEIEVLEAMNGLWKQCMIVKVLGRNVSLMALSRRLREMWKSKGGDGGFESP